MKTLRLLTTLLLVLGTLGLSAQKKNATIRGRVLNENNQPLAGVSVVILGRTDGLSTSDSGTFRVRIPADRPVALLFSFSGYSSVQKNFYLNAGEEESIVIRMEPGGKTLQEVVISDDRQRREAGLLQLDPNQARVLPSTVGGVEGMLKIFVGSNNELSSQYSVRGGNYDENLIYINDFEIFRPYLVRNGQQEGLSFINPDLTHNISFYNGGFPARYGDKISSALDIRYRKPREFKGSAYLSLLEQGFHVEGSGRQEKIRYLLGVRNRSNRNLLGSQETKGNYIPASYDVQAQIQYAPSAKWQWELLGILSRTRFTLEPEESQLTTSVFSPLFSANLGLDIFFDGREEDSYDSRFVGASLTQQISRNVQLKWLAGLLNNEEEERYDIRAAYLFGERDFDKERPTFGTIINPLGAGIFHNFARNRLDIRQLSLSHKGSWNAGNHTLLWGSTLEQTRIDDRLLEWELQDSAGYSIPYNRNPFTLFRYVASNADLDILRVSGYLQDNLTLTPNRSISIQGGIRWNYNDLNRQWLLSPRVQFSWVTGGRQDLVLKASAGAYHQPPFYRELRRYDGSLNPDLKAQRSWQVTAGADYQFLAAKRPFRFTTELYYKWMNDVVPYDIDNVRIRYYGENRARAYAAGLEFRLFGEWVKDAESWVSLGFMRTREDIDDDFYYDYYNAAGELINAQSQDQVATDSTRRDIGWLRRPTDRLITFGLFLQDYLSTNKNFKVSLGLLYGSNMPYNIPNSVRYRNALTVPPYIRADIGFHVLLLNPDPAKRRSRSPFRNFESIWASLEIFNLIDRDNTISYLMIKDFSNTTFAVPNRLTPRLVNLKLLTRF